MNDLSLVIEIQMNIHFIGIGGIGISALAKYYLAKGWKVSGCDLSSSEITDQLKTLGASIRIGQPDPSCVSPDTNMVVHTPAVPPMHPEILQAKNYKLQPKTYPQALGELTKEHFTITVSGCHGKSTTTAMVGLLLMKAGLNPTIIVGTKIKELGNSNFRMGGEPTTNNQQRITNNKVLITSYPSTLLRVNQRQTTNYLVIEADEHFSSFLNYSPRIAIVTNVERDHLDFYKNLANIKKAFKTYIAKIPKEGTLVINKDDKEAKTIVPKRAPYGVVWYSTKSADAKKLGPNMRLPGIHNLSNAMAALQAARLLNIPDNISFAALSSYKGSWRRFEIFKLKTANNAPYTLVSDYGHHPTEIRATLQAARQKWPLNPARGKSKNIWLIFQPHQHQRTFFLWKDFIKTLSSLPIQKLVLLDIFDVAGREETDINKKVSSAKLLKAIQKKNPTYETLRIPTTQEAEIYLKENIKGGEIVLVMGAGNIYNLALRLTQNKPSD
ncbi:MAG: UDP-N-acetylmuramate--L-alanine ligase [Candidatus Wildermuthbacteria bacterium]|nr:UDP-N-acetylmuramate--L-alanine ligase [Candidatus Wildermuthbacteria bacterium]